MWTFGRCRYRDGHQCECTDQRGIRVCEGHSLVGVPRWHLEVVVINQYFLISQQSSLSLLLYRQIYSMWKRIVFLYKFTDEHAQRVAAIDVIHKETNRVIELRRSEFEAAQKSADEDTVAGGDEPSVIGVKRRRAFLESLMVTQRETGSLTDQDIRDEVGTFLFAVSIELKLLNFSFRSV